MSGHSKWANIRRRKEAQDSKRGKIFTKLIKEIAIAARIGGVDMDANPRLRLAVQNAKGVNMPKDNIQRAINKGSGSDGTEYSEITYEGYGPGGVAIFVETTTDNVNRTVSNVRSAFSKYGGSLGTNGSLEFIFQRKGIFTYPVPVDFIEDEFTLEVIDAGAEEVEIEDGYVTVTTAMEDFGRMQKKLDGLQIEVEEAELQRIPNTLVKVEDEIFSKVIKLIETLDDDDDVQKVYHNLDASTEQFESIS
ncbi:MAG TPA: YebC/PmpR family DNA-binding transcriptional regulator [Cyclobacteriaceae bacterium]|jgi:YebC/PmpR family DNA-binding regulatory protein